MAETRILEVLQAETQILEGNVKPYTFTAFDVHPTEPWYMVAESTGRVLIRNGLSEALQQDFDVCNLPVRAVKFIARKQWAIAGADDKQIYVFDYSSGDRVKVFGAHGKRIRCFAVHSIHPYVLSSSDDKHIKLWDWDDDWACKRVFEGHKSCITQVKFNPNVSCAFAAFASASLDKTIKIWDLDSCAPKASLVGHGGVVTCIDFFSGVDQPFIISGSFDRTVKVWDYQTKRVKTTLHGHKHNVSTVYFHPWRPMLITGSWDGVICVWDPMTYGLKESFSCACGRIWDIRYMDAVGGVLFVSNDVIRRRKQQRPVASTQNELSDGERLRLAVEEREVKIVNRSRILTFVDLHPAKPWLLTSLSVGTVSIWNYESKKYGEPFDVCDSPVVSAKFIAREDWFVTGAEDIIRVYDYNTREQMIEYRAHDGPLMCLAVHPIFSYVISTAYGESDNSIKLWDWSNRWCCKQLFKGHSRAVMQVTFNPSDHLSFATASLDHTIKVWIIDKPEPKFTLEGHHEGVTSVDYYPGSDKHYLVSGSLDYTAKVWDYETGTHVQTLEGHGDIVYAVFFHRTQSKIVTASLDGTYIIWVCIGESNLYKRSEETYQSPGKLWAFGYIEDQPMFGISSNGKVAMVKIGEDLVDPIDSSFVSTKGEPGRNRIEFDDDPKPSWREVTSIAGEIDHMQANLVELVSDIEVSKPHLGNDGLASLEKKREDLKKQIRLLENDFHVAMEELLESGVKFEPVVVDKMQDISALRRIRTLFNGKMVNAIWAPNLHCLTSSRLVEAAGRHKLTIGGVPRMSNNVFVRY